MTNEQIGLAIKGRRVFLKIDQKTLSELSGAAVHTISDIESGKGNPTVDVLNKIVAVLGMDLMVKVDNES